MRAGVLVTQLLTSSFATDPSLLRAARRMLVPAQRIFSVRVSSSTPQTTAQQHVVSSKTSCAKTLRQI